MNSKIRFIQIRPKSKSAGGFTLLELLVTVAIVGILVTAGVPELNNFLKNSRLTSQTNTFISVMNYARSESIGRNKNIFITSNDTGNQWGSGWRVWVDGLNTKACEGNGGVGEKEANAPNQQLEESDSGCNEVVKIFDFPDSQVTIEIVGSFSNISAASVKGDLANTTLMFRAGDGTPAIGDNSKFLNFYVCDARTEELGRHIQINRFTGRVGVVDNAYKCS